jgi:hypothetical protein
MLQAFYEVVALIRGHQGARLFYCISSIYPLGPVVQKPGLRTISGDVQILNVQNFLAQRQPW